MVAEDMPETPPGKCVFRALIVERDTGLKRICQGVAATADDVVGLLMEAADGVEVTDPIEWWDRYKIESITAECVGGSV